MSKPLLKLALLGGFIVFAWGMLSWMVFPLHRNCFHQFKDEAKVASVIKENAPEKGMYLLPNAAWYDEHTPQSVMRKARNMMDKGPFMFASIAPDGLKRPVGWSIFFSLATQFIGAFIVGWLLSKTKGLDFLEQVGFVTLFGLGVAILAFFPIWNWLAASFSYVVINVVDMTAGWFLAGLVIARMPKK